MTTWVVIQSTAHVVSNVSIKRSPNAEYLQKNPHSRLEGLIYYTILYCNELWKRTKQPRIDLQIRKRKWGWRCHTLRKPIDDITRQALEGNLQGKRSRGRPKNSWRRTVLEVAKGVKKTWAEIKCVAKNRVRWRNLVDALCSATEWWDYWYYTILYDTLLYYTILYYTKFQCTIPIYYY